MKESLKEPMTDPMIVKSLSLENGKTPEDIFSTLAHLPWAMWLDSCESQHIDSRYDIIVWQPVVTLETFGQHTQVKCAKNKLIETSDEDPLRLVKKHQKLCFEHIKLPQSTLPFKGGALGYLAYDLGERFDNITTVNTTPDTQATMAMGIYTHALIYDQKTGTFSLLCKESEAASLILFLTTLDARKEKKTAFTLTCAWQANMAKNDYHQKFQQVQQYLLNGDCYQINLAQRFEAQYQGDEFLAYQALRKQNQAPFSAFLRFNNRCVLSISPERFMLLQGQQVQTKPIKGTMVRSTNQVQDKANAKALLHSTKDRAENLMIVDLLRNDISKVCQPGSVKVPKLFDIESFPAVHHLVSTIEGQLVNGFHATDLLRGAFPGGSITGAPKIRAMEVIDELEPDKRSIYCGSICYISACGNMDSSITIRTLLCQENTIYCWAGGGLVADSKAESEYQETFDKVAKILPTLAAI